MQAVTRVLIVDDHEIVRKGLKLMLDRHEHFCVVGEAADVESGLRQAEALSPDLAIVDLRLPGLDGLEMIRRLSQRMPGVRVVVLAGEAGAEAVREALRSGVGGYVLKGSPCSEIPYRPGRCP